MKPCTVPDPFIGDTAYRYTYDAVGNITKIEKGQRATSGSDATTATGYTTLAEYYYDFNYQLRRENNAQLNKTIMYTYYGNGGNRLTRKEYPYQTGDMAPTGTPVTTTYTYGDATWGDLLTGITTPDGTQTITYDAIGNPTSYRGYTMDWRGRQLNYALKGTAMSVYTYDADGLRTSKNQSNGTVSNYCYVNGRLAYEKRGDKELYYV